MFQAKTYPVAHGFHQDRVTTQSNLHLKDSPIHLPQILAA